MLDNEIYDTKRVFGRDHIIAKPFDKGLITVVFFVVVQAVAESRISDKTGFDMEAY